MYVQKLLLAVLCGQCWLHLSHLPCLWPPTEPTGISIWTPHCCWQHRHSKRSNLSPAATGAPGTVPALISAHTGHTLFTLSKCSEAFNLPKDCPLVCPHGRGMKLVIIKKEKTSYSSFSSLLCEEHAQLRWYSRGNTLSLQQWHKGEWTGGNSAGSRSLSGARDHGVSQYAFPLYAVIWEI